MVVDDLNAMGAGVPSETDAPLVIDPNAVLTGSITTQGFKPIAWWNTKVVEPGRGIQQLQLTACHPLDHSERLTGES